MFVDPENGDCHLDEDSPCIDAGDPGSPNDPDSTIADMGCFYYDQFYVTITVFNLLGQKIIDLTDEVYQAGTHQIVWDGVSSNGQLVSTGIYFYRLIAGDYIDTKKMILLK
jgi:hypothetical protein